MAWHADLTSSAKDSATAASRTAASISASCRADSASASLIAIARLSASSSSASSAAAEAEDEVGGGAGGYFRGDGDEAAGDGADLTDAPLTAWIAISSSSRFRLTIRRRNVSKSGAQHGSQLSRTAAVLPIHSAILTVKRKEVR